MATISAKASTISSATGSDISLLVIDPVVLMVARLDPIEVLSTVGTTGDNDSVGALIHVASRYR